MGAAQPAVELFSSSAILFLYSAALALAVLGAASELMGRFRDEPLRIVYSRPGILYLFLNAVLAVIVLAALRYASRPQTGILALEQVILAGFGARFLVKTKVVGWRGRDGKSEDIGPGTFFERMLTSISRTADRGRAADRLRFVSELLDGIAWEQARTLFAVEMAGAMQDLTDEEKSLIQKNLRIIDTKRDLDDSTRVHLLGYLILEYAGEEFLRVLADLYFRRHPKDAGSSAPSRS